MQVLFTTHSIALAAAIFLLLGIDSAPKLRRTCTETELGVLR